MKKFICPLATVFLAANAQASIVYTDDFSTDPIGGPVWNLNVTDVASYDGANQQVDYDHTAGTTRRFANHNTGLLSSTEGYMRADISNFTGSPDGVWIGFIEDNAANNANYVTADVTQNGTIELFFNNTAASIPFDNGNGWSGTLAANSVIGSWDNGSTSAANLTVGGSVDTGVALKGFGFANFGNATVFPDASFSVDSVTVGDSAVVPEPSVALLGGLGLLGLLRRRRS